MRDAGAWGGQLQRWVAHTRVIATPLFTYPQVCEYGSCHFCLRLLAMRLSAAFASTPRRLSTEATKGVKFLRLFKQLLRYFRLFSCSAIFRHYSGVLDW